MQRNAAICDDNIIHLNKLKSLLESTGSFKEISCYSDLDAVKADILSNRVFDLVFMDFDWDQQEGGIELASLLYKHCPSAQVIFVTSYTKEYIQQVFFQRVNIAGFLIKPVAAEKLNTLLLSLDRQRDCFELPVNGKMIRYYTDEVPYIDSHDHYIEVHRNDHTADQIRIKLAEAEKLLPPCYFKCHKSYLVNLQLVESFDHKDITLRNGEKIYLARSKYKAFEEALLRFVGSSV